jgi:hypothetical protein
MRLAPEKSISIQVYHFSLFSKAVRRPDRQLDCSGLATFITRNILERIDALLEHLDGH